MKNVLNLVTTIRVLGDMGAGGPKNKTRELPRMARVFKNFSASIFQNNRR